jgi:hypothetical protein
VDSDALEKVQIEAKQVIRSVMIPQFAKSLSPVAINILLDSLRVLSEKGGYYSFARLSKSIDNFKSKLYLTGKVIGAGRNPADSVVQSLLSLLVSQGVNPNDMAVQWTEMFLKTRGIEFIDFDFYKK